MDSKSCAKVEEFLASECSDYGLSYEWRWEEDYECFVVTITSERTDLSKEVNFQYASKKDELFIEMGEDTWEVVTHYDWRVKYFWMLVAPALFPE